MKYYIYLDDSNKFEKVKNKFVLYSFVIFTKQNRLQNEQQFLNTFNLVKNYPNLFDLKNSALSKDDILYGPLKDKGNKGHDLICKYNRALNNIKKHNKQIDIDFVNNMQQLLLTFKNVKYIGTLYWCKECSDKKNWNTYDQIKNKKKYMLKIILKKLLDNQVISKNDEINIYLDEEFNDEPNSILGEYFKEYLNAPINKFYIGTEPMTYKLRMNNIVVKNLEFIDSDISIPIRMADIIANYSNKMLKSKSDWVSDPINFSNFFNNNKIEINYLFFPGFRYNKDVSLIKCAHF